MQLRTDPNLRWTRWAEASALFVAVLAATAYSLLLTRHTGSNVTMWIADGVVVGALLRVSDERWPRYLGAAFAGYFTGKMLLGDPLMFYALARYNGIDPPSQALDGRTVMIPGEPKVAPAPRPAAPKPAAPPPAAANKDPARAAVQVVADE